MPFVCIPFGATWMTGYSGQEKTALTSCDSGKVIHSGSWPLNTQGSGSSLRGWLAAPLSLLVIGWLLGWTSCPTFSDKLCLKEWWAACHQCSLVELLKINCLAAQHWQSFSLKNGCWRGLCWVGMTLFVSLVAYFNLKKQDFFFSLPHSPSCQISEKYH